MEIQRRKDYFLRLPSNLQKRIDLMKLDSNDHREMVRTAIAEIVSNTDKSQVKEINELNMILTHITNSRL